MATGAAVTDISVFIPIFRESECLSKLLDRLIEQNVRKEIIVAIDEPERGFFEEMSRYKDVKFIVNKKRIGKVNALNNAVKESSGKVLVFLDSDIEIDDDQSFLKKIYERMKEVDVLDIKKKVIRTSFLSKMAYYEYFTFNVSSWIASKYLQKCPATNGAAFAIKREVFDEVGGFKNVVAEDIDIATRAFLKEHSFAYATDVEVKNIVHSNWKSWFIQRERWAVGQALWLKDYYKSLFRKCIVKPQIFFPALFFLYPPLISFSLNFLLPSAWLYDLLTVFSWFVSIKFTTVLPIFLISIPAADIAKSMLITFSSFGVTAVLFYRFSRKLGFEFKLHEVFVYYFFYSVLWIAVIFIGYFQVLVLRKTTAPNWKT
ncbi:MAG TPA: glycosyltransferase family 2 protein [Candidatus Sulfotelmatobacter sp.]|nr:glycosyltransferase family 2 protein [Candidatus Sulfotelmatobacter sp.]